jgi:hypothetical protein
MMSRRRAIRDARERHGAACLRQRLLCLIFEDARMPDAAMMPPLPLCAADLQTRAAAERLMSADDKNMLCCQRAATLINMPPMLQQRRTRRDRCQRGSKQDMRRS